MDSVAEFRTCPCDAGKAYVNCCGALHREGSAGIGTTAEQTMRARYSAYVVGDASFVLETWHRSSRPSKIDFNSDIDWHGLDVMTTQGGGSLDTEGSVEFRARFRRGDAHLELHELSSFTRESGRWYYVDGIDPDTTAT